MILLDTNVVSEILRPAPEPKVIHWLNTRSAECAISSIAVLELRFGVATLPRGKRRTALEAFLDRVIRRFAGRVYVFDVAAAEACVKLAELARSAGRGLDQLPDKLADLQTAGIAVSNNLPLATRNTRDFQGLGIDLIDPWKAP